MKSEDDVAPNQATYCKATGIPHKATSTVVAMSYPSRGYFNIDNMTNRESKMIGYAHKW